MENMFITIKEASELTGKSLNTIKRFITKHKADYPTRFEEYASKNNSISCRIDKLFLLAQLEGTVNPKTGDTIRPGMDSNKQIIVDSIKSQSNSRNSVGIKSNSDTNSETDSVHSEQKEAFKYKTDNINPNFDSVNAAKNDSIADTMREKKEAMQIVYNSEIIKQKNDTITRLIEGQKKPFTRLPVFWTVVGFLVLFTFSITAVFYLKDDFLAAHLAVHKERLVSQQKQYQDLQKQYNREIGRIEQSNQKLMDVYEKQIKELTAKLEGTEKKLNEKIEKGRALVPVPQQSFYPFANVLSDPFELRSGGRHI